MIKDREVLIDNLTQHIIAAMDLDELMGYAYKQMSGYFSKLSDEELTAECDNADFTIECN